MKYFLPTLYFKVHQEFADDIILDYSHSDPKEVTERLSQGVTALAQWLDKLGLLLNKKKTQVMFIKPRGLADVQNQVYCGKERLNTVTSAKYLGVTIDDELSWRTYLSHLSTKSRQASSRLWRQPQCSQSVSPKNLVPSNDSSKVMLRFKFLLSVPQC